MKPVVLQSLDMELVIESSIRIPWQVERDGKGYLEDEASN